MIRQNREDIHPDFGLKQLKLKRGDVRVKTGKFDCIGLEGQARSIHADQHKPTTRRRKF